MLESAQVVPRSAGSTTSPARGARTDIQALRAIAVAAVVAYHLWPGRLPGGFVGVDVFFVISGFLITSHLLRRPPRHGRDLRDFWARRVRRLLPASFLVLLVTAAATFVVAPSTMWASTLREIGASALYVENWSLAASSVDYLGAEAAASPVQHYWSLSVEEQFYLLWPLVLVAVGWWTARRGGNLVRRASVAVGAIVLLSFGWSVVATALQPSSAYFVTPTRIWELGVGALLATLSIRLAPRWRTPLAWLGIAMILAAVLTYSGALPFPGYTAALPVVGCALVIAAECDRTRWSPRRIGDVRPVQWLGDVSYSVYLWHWPLVVLVPFALGHHPGLLERVAVLACALGLAAVTKPLVEDRFRRGRAGSGRAIAIALSASVLIGGAAIGGALLLQARVDANIAQAAQAAHGPCVGAAAMAPGADCDVAGDGDLLLDPVEAADDKPSAYADGCWESLPFDGTSTCRYGDPDAATKVALIGNSHAGNLLPPLQDLAEKNDWSITTYVASRCPTSDVRWQLGTARDSEGCHDWGQRVLDKVRDGSFDLVVTSQLTPYAAAGTTSADNDAVVAQGYSRYLDDLAATGTPTLVVRDMPYPKHTIPSVPDCLAAASSPTGCDGKRSAWLAPDPLYDAAESLDQPAVSTLDLTGFTCTKDVCPAVIGDVVVYFDASHLTATFSRTLAPYLEPAVVSALGSP
ncbi:acyltransferase family protein [Isoptericola sp. NPDC057653]|uniref:acyltransferase family protein n=1 Tax=Isoptericola sp. NPDC057653 TaxID=3346195 RepID=UPI003677DAA8